MNDVMPYSGYEGSLEAILREFLLYLRSTFGPALTYVGTTTDVNTRHPGELRDLDIIVVFSEMNEAHLSYLWRIINRLHAKYNILLDTRVYCTSALHSIPIINQYLLKLFLIDQHGKNPFSEATYSYSDLATACSARIKEQQEHIISVMPRIAGESSHLKSVAQSVYDAIRAFLILQNRPLANKEQACEYFVKTFPRFREAAAIYRAYLDPHSIVDVTAFLFDSLAIVEHLRYKSAALPLADEVLLINTPSAYMPHPRNDYLSYDHNMPLGLVCLASYLQSAGVSTRVLDSYAENLGVLTTTDRIFGSGRPSRIIGLNASSPNIHIALKLAAYIKRINEQIVVIAGGPHPSLAPEHTLHTGDIDFVVFGEGEESLLTLARQILGGSEVRTGSIPGVLSMVSGNVVGDPASPPLDLSTLPTPEFDVLPLDRYFGVRRRLYIHTSRGCAYNCIFCSVPKTSGRRVRQFSAERLYTVISESLQKHPGCEIQIVDDNFSHKNGALIRQLCDIIAKNNLSFRWKCQARADSLDAEVIGLMARTGCFEIDLGIESGDSEIQRYIRKHLDLARTMEIVNTISRNEIKCKGFFMLGFPQETPEQLAATVNYAISLKQQGLEDVAFFPVMPFPGTEIAALARQHVFQGAVIDDIDMYERTFAADRLRKYSAKPEVSLNPRFTPEGLRVLVKFAYQRFELGLAVKELQQEMEVYSQSQESMIYGL